MLLHDTEPKPPNTLYGVPSARRSTSSPSTRICFQSIEGSSKRSSGRSAGSAAVAAGASGADAAGRRRDR